jgi:hypothetical protein
VWKRKRDGRTLLTGMPQIKRTKEKRSRTNENRKTAGISKTHNAHNGIGVHGKRKGNIIWDNGGDNGELRRHKGINKNKTKIKETESAHHRLHLKARITRTIITIRIDSHTICVFKVHC